MTFLSAALTKNPAHAGKLQKNECWPNCKRGINLPLPPGVLPVAGAGIQDCQLYYNPFFDFLAAEEAPLAS